MDIEIPQTPCEFAEDIALAGFGNFSFYVNSPRDLEDLDQLDDMASKAGLMGDWAIEAERAYIIPAIGEVSVRNLEIGVLSDIRFKGSFLCYSRVNIGRVLGFNAVRSLCMTFDNGVLADPEIIFIEDDQLLHIPVLATQDMSRD